VTRRRRLVTVAVALLATFVVAATAGWLALPSLARRAVIWQVEAQTGRRLTMDAFDLDVRGGHLRIAGLRLADREPGPPLAEFERLDVRFRPAALLRGHLHVEEIALAAPRVRIVRLARGVLNISDLLDRPRKPSSGVSPLTLDRLALTGGTVLFEDRTLNPPRTWRADGLMIDAGALSTVSPEPRGSLRLAVTVAGAPLSVEASSVRLAPPMQGRARVTLQNVDATLANLYLPADTAVALDRAVIGAAFDAAIDAQGGVGLDGQARIDNLVVRRRGVDTSLVTVPALTFALASGRSPEGRLLARVEVNGRATVFDPRPGQSTRFEIDKFRLVADGLDATGRAPARLTASAALPGGGVLDVQGSARPTPVAAEMRARISRVDLAFWAPYFSLPVEFTGMAETDLTVETTAAGPRVRGRALVKNVTVADDDRRLAAADLVELSGIDAQWPKAKIERLRLSRPRARIGRDREGRLTISELVESMKRPTAAPPAAASVVAPRAKPSALPPDFAIELGEVAVEDGRVRLEDGMVEPAAVFRLAPIRMSARDLTWPSRRPATLQLTAGTPEGGTIETQGTLASLDPVRFELRTRLVGISITPYRPYAPLVARIEGRIDGEISTTGTMGGGKTELNAKGSVGLGDLAFVDGDRSILTVGRLDLVGLDYTYPATASLERVHMRKSWVLIERRADGSLPITGILTAARRSTPGAEPAAPAPAPPPAPAPAPTAPPAAGSGPAVQITVREALFEDGGATVVDAAVSPTTRVEVAGVRLHARDFAWPARAPVPVRFEAPTPGSGRITAQGALDLAARSLELQVTPSGVDLGPAQPYLPVRGRVTGKASGDLAVKATLEPFALTARGTAAITDMALADTGEPLMTAARLESTGIEFAYPAAVTIDLVSLQKPWARIERAADGSFPLRALLEPPARPAGAPARVESRASTGPAPPPAPELDLRVRRAAVEDGAFALVDSTVRPTARAEIRDARLVVRNFTWPAREPSEIRLRASTGTGGSVDARGQIRLDTQAIDLQLAIKQLDLAVAQTFLPSRGTLAGKLDSDLRVKGTLSPLSVAASGRMAVDDTIFGDGQRMLAYIKRVDMAGLDADWPRRVTIQRVAIDKPWALVERESDGRLPLLDLLTPGGPAPPASPTTSPAPAPGAPSRGPAPPPADGAPPAITLGDLTVDEGFIRFVDRTTTPAFTEEASRIMMTGRGLGTGKSGQGRLTLNGRLTGGAPFELKGAIGALGGPVNVDLEGKLSDFPLPRVNPYANKLIGWIARRGAFGTTVHYRVTDNVLTATNEVVLGQPDFAPSRSGDEVRDRVGVPFGLLVGLLKNAKGEVRLSVPVTGNLASRQFDLTDAFWEAVRKAAISVMALPVSWVGKIFYTEDERVETIQIWPVYFEPGTTRFAQGFDRHAERLGGFLRDAPGVNLAMKSVLTVDDIAALKRDVVRQRVEAAARETPGGAEAAAARLFAERNPGRPVPSGLDAIVAELVRDEPNPDAAARTLSARRMETTRAQLQAAVKVAPERLRVTEGLVPVEGSGQGRVEFEIAP